MHDTLAIFQFLADRRAKGEAVALVTLTNAQGPSSRDPGAHMAVSETGAYVGSFSGGCIEAAVVSEARAAIADGLPRQVRYGAGSPFIDIRLPCGGAVELLISPVVSDEFATAVVALFGQRQPVELTLSLTSTPVVGRSAALHNQTYWGEKIFHVHHMPPLRIVVLGSGAPVEKMFSLASSFGAVLDILTPDRAMAASISARGGNVRVLNTLVQAAEFAADPWTACICLFHDHDWETGALRHAAASGAFYVGAMGSRSTAKTRRTILLDAGMDAADVDRIRGPIGLMQQSRDPHTLALSVLAEIVDAYNRLVMPQTGEKNAGRGSAFGNERVPIVADD